MTCESGSDSVPYFFICFKMSIIVMSYTCREGKLISKKKRGVKIININISVKYKCIEDKNSTNNYLVYLGNLLSFNRSGQLLFGHFLLIQWSFLIFNIFYAVPKAI